MFATYSRTQAVCASIQPVFSGLRISAPRYIRLMAFFETPSPVWTWKFLSFLLRREKD